MHTATFSSFCALAVSALPLGLDGVSHAQLFCAQLLSCLSFFRALTTSCTSATSPSSARAHDASFVFDCFFFTELHVALWLVIDVKVS